MSQNTPTSVALRDYQARNLEAVRAAMRQYRSTLLVEPCGSGKGTEATYIVRSAVAKGRRVMFLVNRRTLVRDMSRRLDRLGLEHGIIMGSDPRHDPSLPIQIASIDTLHRRERIPAADLLILDEAHFAVSPTWRAVVDRYPAAKILGMTATPIRLDGLGLGEMFNVMIQGLSVVELISRGFLVPSRTFAPSTPELAGVKKTAGDFNQRQLAEACDRKKLVGDIVAHWKRLSADRKTVSFGVDQKHAQHIAEQFRCSGVDCAYVDADTGDDERDRIWDDLDHGRLPIVSSVGIISYGWDHPVVSTVILARPTESLQLHLQQIGRGSRPAPGKTDLLVLDHAGNTHRHGIYEDERDWSLHGAALRESGNQESVPITTCRKCFGVFRSGVVDVCPYCGAPVEKQTRSIKTVNAELEEFRRQQKQDAIEDWRARMTADKKRERFTEFRRIAAERGYKPGWPMVQFKVQFGHWPPAAWLRREITA